MTDPHESLRSLLAENERLKRDALPDVPVSEDVLWDTYANSSGARAGLRAVYRLGVGAMVRAMRAEPTMHAAVNARNGEAPTNRVLDAAITAALSQLGETEVATANELSDAQRALALAKADVEKLKRALDLERERHAEEVAELRKALAQHADMAHEARTEPSMRALLDEVWKPSPVAVGAEGSVMREAWNLGCAHKSAVGFLKGQIEEKDAFIRKAEADYKRALDLERETVRVLTVERDQARQERDEARAEVERITEEHYREVGMADSRAAEVERLKSELATATDLLGMAKRYGEEQRARADSLAEEVERLKAENARGYIKDLSRVRREWAEMRDAEKARADRAEAILGALTGEKAVDACARGYWSGGGQDETWDDVKAEDAAACRKVLGEMRAGVTAAIAAATEQVDGAGKVERCKVCGWPLHEKATDGCTAASCSYRPAEGSAEHARIKARREELKAAPKPAPERLSLCVPTHLDRYTDALRSVAPADWSAEVNGMLADIGHDLQDAMDAINDLRGVRS